MINQKKFALWCEGLAEYLNAGIGIKDYLEEASLDKKSQYKVYNKKVSKNLEEGKLLFESIIYPNKGKQMFYPIAVQTGEISGKLPKTLGMLSEYIQFMENIKLQIKSVIINLYLKILGLTALFSGALVLLDYIGKGDIDFLGIGLYGTEGAKMLMGGSMLMSVVSLFCIFIFIKVKDVYWIERIILKGPIIGACFKDFTMYRMTFIMQLLFDTPLSIERTLQLSYQSTGSAVFNSHLSGVLQKLDEGSTLRIALEEHKGLSDKFLQYIRFAEHAGTLSNTLTKVSAQYKESGEKRLIRLQNTIAILTKALMFVVCISGIGSIMYSIAIKPMIHVFDKLL